jgi:hypothetical protein
MAPSTLLDSEEGNDLTYLELLILKMNDFFPSNENEL